MPSGGGPVYQPTTVSYEPRSGGNTGAGSPLGFLGQSSSLGMDSPLRMLRQSRRLQLLLLLFMVFSLALGIFLTITSVTTLMEVQECLNEKEDGRFCPEYPMEMILIGVLLNGLGLCALVIHIKVSDFWPCNCCFNKKQKALARQLQCENGGGCGQGILALNPSTDPLVSHTQYAPVSELPSMRVEDEERRNLMPDNKDCLSSAEESDRMLEPDPRIVLRPMGRVEDA